MTLCSSTSRIIVSTSSGCYGDLYFSNKLYLNDATASNATNFTLDGYVTTDAAANTASEAIEYTIEQDIPSATANAWDKYIYSWQCNNLGSTNSIGEHTGGTWNYWDGSLRSGKGDWRPATTVGGTTVPCQKYTPGQYTHYYFHFQRLANRQIKFLDFTAVVGTVHTYYQFNIVATIQSPVANWATGLKTAIQLDGDSAQDPYSIFLDKWIVAYQ